MPIYAYRCQECGFDKDVLQKISDAPLTECPACSKPAFKKQLTAAGFQLKGTGWYVTDFKGGNNGGKPAPAVAAPASDGAKSAAAPAAPAASAAAGSDTPAPAAS